jgi:hypothetical protein
MFLAFTMYPLKSYHSIHNVNTALKEYYHFLLLWYIHVHFYSALH